MATAWRVHLIGGSTDVSNIHSELSHEIEVPGLSGE